MLIAISSIAAKSVLLESYIDHNTNNLKDIGFWSENFSGYTTEYRGVKFIDVVSEDIIWTVAYDGSGAGEIITEFTVTSDGGENWTHNEVATSSTGYLGMIKAIDAITAYAIITEGSNQGVYVTTDAGISWSRQTSANFNYSSSYPNLVHFFNETDGFAQGDPVDGYYEMYTTTDAGENWSRVPTENIPAPISGEYGVVSYYDSFGDNIWFGTTKGRVYRSNDKGLNWEVSETGLPKYIDVTFKDEMNGLIMDRDFGSTGRLFETHDGGITWSEIFAVGLVYISDFEFIPGTNTVISVGGAEGNTGATYSFDGGHNWQNWTDQEGIQMLSTDWISPTVGFAGGFSDANSTKGIFKYEGNLVGIEDNYELAITNYELKQNYPNPFNPVTRINYELGITNYELAEIVVHNSVGQEVWSSNPLTLNPNHCLFDGSKLNSGIYYYSLVIDKKVISTKSMVLIK